MKGKYRVVVQNNRLHYEFEIRRNVTIIQGDSATGKTTLINMLRQAENLGRSSGVDVVCEVPCRVLEGANWKLLLQNMHGNIIFTDEENAFINTEEFAAEVAFIWKISEYKKSVSADVSDLFGNAALPVRTGEIARRRF